MFSWSADGVTSKTTLAGHNKLPPTRTFNIDPNARATPVEHPNPADLGLEHMPSSTGMQIETRGPSMRSKELGITSETWGTMDSSVCLARGGMTTRSCYTEEPEKRLEENTGLAGRILAGGSIPGGGDNRWYTGAMLLR